MESKNYYKIQFMIVVTLLFLSVRGVYAQSTLPGIVPTLSSPSNGATGVSTSPTLSWNSVLGATSYHVQVSTVSDFSTTVINKSGITSTSYSASGLSNSTTYYWRVQASNSLSTSSWSNVWHFTTQAASTSPPPAPTLSSPANGATGISTAPSFSWNASTGASSYHLQVSTSSGFSSTVIDKSGISSTSYSASGLSAGTTYYWRVAASNSGGSSSYSTTWSFTTKSSSTSPPPAPTLSSPANGATGISTAPSFSWNASTGASSYHLQVSTSSGFSSTVIDKSGISSTSYSASGLSAGTTYYWRVAASNSGGSSSFSTAWSFTTKSSSVPSITLISPKAGDLWINSKSYTISWSSNKVINVRIRYSPDGGKIWKSITDSLPASNDSYTWSPPDTTTVDARVMITALHNPQASDTSAVFSLYGSKLYVSQQLDFNDPYKTSDYRLFGFPAQPGIPLAKLISGTPNQDWTAYYDDGSKQNYLTRYDGSSHFIFKPGTAFWIISKNKIKINTSVKSVTLSPDTSYSIPLHKGWNIISNPFGAPVLWKDVQRKNHIQEPIWDFTGKFSTTRVFDRYKGYYFFNKDSLSALKIPYAPEDSVVQSKAEPLTGMDPIVMSAYSGDSLMSSIYVGVSHLDGRKYPQYQYAPPGDFQSTKLIINDNPGGNRTDMSVEIKKEESGSARKFNIYLQAHKDKRIELRVAGLQHYKNFHLRLYNISASKSYDLQHTQVISFIPGKKETHFVLTFSRGTSGQILADSLLTGKLQLGQNYPNPFTTQTTIKYTIPASLDMKDVKIEIFNILGERVTTLLDRKLTAGSYQIQWDAGQQTASGIYLYRLTAGNKSRIRKMTLLK